MQNSIKVIKLYSLCSSDQKKNICKMNRMVQASKIEEAESNDSNVWKKKKKEKRAREKIKCRCMVYVKLCIESIEYD